MQTQIFTKTKIALAVGTALMVMAGSANAALPTLRTAGHSTLIATVDGGTLNANIKQMLTTTGLINKAFTFDVTLNSGVGAGTGAIDSDTVGIIDKAGAGSTLVMGNGTLGNNHIVVYTGTTATQVPSTGATAVIGASVAGVAHIAVSMPAPGANKGYRINAGVLEFSSDTSIASPVWAAVKMDLQDVGGAEIYTEVANAGYVLADDLKMAAITGTAIETSLAPTPVATTTGAPTAASPLINGVSIDTIVPIDAFTVVTNVAVTSQDPLACEATLTGATAASTGSSSVALTSTSVTATLGTAAAATATLPPTFKNTVAFLGAADWTNGPAADDLLFAASPNCLNTGLVGAGLPVVLSAGTTPPKYTQVFNTADGVGKTVTFHATTSSNGVISSGDATDGVAPVIVANGINFTAPAGSPAVTNMSVKFSEPMAFNTGVFGDANNLREVLENIFVGSTTTTLAALSLNSATTPALAALATSNGQGILTVNNVLATDVATVANGVYTGKSISVGRGITFQEPNDANYTANVTAGTLLDDDSGTGALGEELMGGVKSATGVVEAVPATPVAQTASVAAASIAWGTDTSALASASSVANPDLIDTITVTFPAGKNVKLAPQGTTFGNATALAAAKTSADLLTNLVIDVWGTNGIKFQVRPTAVTGSAATTTGGNTLTVTVPTAFIYSKLKKDNAALYAMYIGYVADGNNQANNTLVGTDAASTLTSPIRVEAGTATPAGILSAQLTAAGAEPVVLPLVFTATQTGGQSTLLTQNIQSNIVGSTAGSIVKAYLAYWVDLPKQSIALVGADLKSGKITNPGDKVATDLAIEFADGTGNGVASLILTELQAVKPKQEPKPGVQAAEGPTPAKDIPVYVKLVRSNDTANANAQTTSQNYLNARAIMAPTYALAKAAAETTIDTQSPVYEVLLNPVTGEIKGRLTGNIVIKPSSSTGNRGLRFLDMNGKDTATATVHGSSIVAQKSATGLALPGTANVNLLMGIDPLTTDFGGITALNPFVLLTHQDSTGKYTLLTSADPTAANYMPFAPDVMNRATGTGGIATRATALLSVTDVRSFDLPKSPNWALYGFGNPATKAVATGPASGPSVSPDKAFPRMFVGLDTVNGDPESFWTTDTNAVQNKGDIAMSVAGNAVGVATELTSDTGKLTGPTLSNIGGENLVKGAVAVGWANEQGAADGATAKLGKIYVAQATGPFAPAVAAPAPKVKKGWSLVTIPGTVGQTGTLNATTIDAVIKVGAQVGLTGTTLTAEGTGAGLGNGQFTWFAVDGTMPTLTAGDAVFVHAKSDGSL